MNFSESIAFDARLLVELRRLVKRGEGIRLEFKRKASFPEKIVRELIAFANAEGGTLLIGVDDNGEIPGVKYPEEELVVVRKALEQRARPSIHVTESIIPLSEKKFVVQLDVHTDTKRPHWFVTPDAKVCYVRVADKSIQASREMTEIVRRSSKEKDIRFTIGEAEQKLFQYLAINTSISLPAFRQLTGLNRFMAARKLILLVLANVLKITPSEKGDTFSRTA
jgi:predicted HTH transcriptional regulator